MNNSFEKIIEKARLFSLSSLEKESLRQQLVVRINISQRPLFERGSFRFIFVKSKLALAGLIIIFFSGGVSLAAEKSLPGSPFYLIKVGFNEEMKRLFAGSEANRIEWELVRAEKRFAEISELVAGNRFTEKARRQTERQLDRHLNRLTEKIDLLEKTGQIAAAVDLVSTLENILQIQEERLLETVPDLSRHLETIAKRSPLLEKTLVQTAAAQAAAEKKLRTVEQKITSARRLLKKQAGLKEKLTEAETAFNHGRRQLIDAAYDESFFLFNDAQRVLLEAAAPELNQLKNKKLK